MSDLINSLTPSVTYDGNLTPTGYIEGTLGTIVYAHNYNDLSNKPSINNVTLTGNKTAADLNLLTAGDIPVTSVNNMTGNVYLSGSNLRYDANDTINEKIAEVAASIPTIPVTTVNGLTGDVVLNGENVNYDVGTTLNDKIDDIESQITASGVSSVNGQTGVVTLDGDDIEYSAGVTVNDKIDAVEASIPVVSYPVTSVNGETGAVTLDGADIEYSAGVTVNSKIDTVDGKTTTNATAIGDLSTLTTSVQSSLVGAVNEVNELTDNNLSVATYGGTIYYRKYGHIVEVTSTGIGSTTSIAQGNEPTLATLPSGFRPKRELNPIGYSRNSFSNSRMLGYTIGTNGNIKVYAYEEISNGRFTCTYIVD